MLQAGGANLGIESKKPVCKAMSLIGMAQEGSIEREDKGSEDSWAA